MTHAAPVLAFARRALGAVAVLTAVVRPAAAAPFHATLLRSEPAAGSLSERPPERLRLVFSEPIDVGLSQVALVASNGSVIKLVPLADSTDVRALVATVPPLAAGGYRVNWRIASADGHPVSGTFVFGVAAPAADTTRAEPAPRPEPPPAAEGEPAVGTATAPGTPVVAAVLRGLGIGALAALAGVLAFVAWVTRAPAPRLRRLATWLGVAAVLALAAHAVAWMRYVSPTSSLDADVMRSAVATATGTVEAARVGLALLALWALVVARRVGLAAVVALLAVAVSGALGHPAAIRPALAVPAKSIHLLAMALWLGGLLVLALGQSDDAGDAERVSSAALVSVIAIALTGVLQTVLFLNRPADLVRTTYGLLVLGKVAGLGVLVLFGARNRYRLVPALAGGGQAALRRSVRWEMAVMAAVVLLGGLLAYVPVPLP